jgi:leader peptidase (prepilin peptidase)/N-methyltransferase
MDLSDLVPLIVAPFIGSFLGVLVRRLPRGEPVFLARSRCESCAAALTPADLVPVLSYFCFRGSCRHCGARIPLFHVLIELAAVGVALSAMLAFSGIDLWLWCILGWGLLALAWIDAEWMVLPDCLTLPLLATGLGAGAVLTPETMTSRLAGAIAGWGLFAGVAYLYRLLRGRDGLGGGDAKLLAVAGAWLGAEMLPYVMFVSAFCAAARALTIRRPPGQTISNVPMPFGPWIALTVWLAGLLSGLS